MSFTPRRGGRCKPRRGLCFLRSHIFYSLEGELWPASRCTKTRRSVPCCNHPCAGDRWHHAGKRRRLLRRGRGGYCGNSAVSANAGLGEPRSRASAGLPAKSLITLRASAPLLAIPAPDRRSLRSSRPRIAGIGRFAAIRCFLPRGGRCATVKRLHR